MEPCDYPKTAPSIGDDEVWELFGIEEKGKVNGSDPVVDITQSDLFNEQTLQSYGKAVKVEYDGNEGNILGWVSEQGRSRGDDDDDDDDSDDNDHDDDDKGRKYPAIIKGEYGAGKALFYTFNLGLSATSEQFDQFVTILRKSLGYVHTKRNTVATYRPYDWALGIDQGGGAGHCHRGQCRHCILE